VVTADTLTPDMLLAHVRANGKAKAGPNPETLTSLLDDVVAYLTRYIHFARPEQAWAIALWIGCTGLFEGGYPYDVVPYLLITSAEKESGKTTTLDMIGHASRRSMRVDNVSSASLVRLLKDEPTILLDEVDTLFKNGEKSETAEVLRGVLNGGYRKGGVYTRFNAKTNKVESHPTFSPKAMTAVGRYVPDSIVGRSVYVRMERKAPGITLPKARERVVKAEGEALWERIAATVPALELGFLDMDVVAPPDLSSRQQDLWEPLYALALQAGGEWPERARAASLNLTASDAESMSIGQRLLRSIRTVFEDEGADALHTLDLIGQPEDPDTRFGHDASGLCAIEDEAWGSYNRGKPITPYQVAKMLREYGIEPSRPRVDGKQAAGYAWSDFNDAWRTYLPEPTEGG
jgi:hypothetical protein